MKSPVKQHPNTSTGSGTGWIKRKAANVNVNFRTPKTNRLNSLEKWLNVSPENAVLEANIYYPVPGVLITSPALPTSAKRKPGSGHSRRRQNTNPNPSPSPNSDRDSLSRLFTKSILRSKSLKVDTVTEEFRKSECKEGIRSLDGSTTFFNSSSITDFLDSTTESSPKLPLPPETKSLEPTELSDSEFDKTISTDEDSEIIPCTPPQRKPPPGKRRKIQTVHQQVDQLLDEIDDEDYLPKTIPSISMLSPIQSEQQFFEPTIVDDEIGETYFDPGSGNNTITTPVSTSKTKTPVEKTDHSVDVDETYFPGWKSFISRNDETLESDDAENIPCTPPMTKPKSNLRNNFIAQFKEYIPEAEASSFLHLKSPRKPLAESPAKNTPGSGFNTPKKSPRKPLGESPLKNESGWGFNTPKKDQFFFSPNKPDITLNAIFNFNKLPSPVGSKYKYRPEKVRKKDDRKKLPGWDCPECQAYYGNFESQYTTQELANLRNKCSRHRGKEQKVEYLNETPLFYWETDMPETEDLINQGMVRIGTRSPVTKKYA